MTNTGTAPWIGMPAQMDPDDEKQYLSRNYSDAVKTAGGLPVIIPLLSEPGGIHPLAESIDGILLTGNDSDLDPALYGAERREVCGPVEPARERMDYFLLETALRRRIPVLAICFGMQSLNVFLGGSLIQDISSSLGSRIRHRDPSRKEVPEHSIQISSGSVLEQLAGASESIVNSTHHQAVERPGIGLEVIARAPDGVIECVSGTDPRQWLLGVQWHPEKSFDRDHLSRNLFEYFLARCRAVRGD